MPWIKKIYDEDYLHPCCTPIEATEGPNKLKTGSVWQCLECEAEWEFIRIGWGNKPVYKLVKRGKPPCA